MQPPSGVIFVCHDGRCSQTVNLTKNAIFLFGNIEKSTNERHRVTWSIVVRPFYIDLDICTIHLYIDHSQDRDPGQTTVGTTFPGVHKLTCHFA